MNETFAKILKFSIIFWLVLSLFSTIFAERIQTYFIEDDAITIMVDDVGPGEINLISGLNILYNIMLFNVSGQVPFWTGAILDLILVLTGLSIIIAIFDR